jgi:galactokinase/mevalonate kinase-like predicted kinase
MTFTSEEKRLLILYHSGSVRDTAAVIMDALNDITDRDERAAALGVFRKLGAMSAAEFEAVDPERGAIYD